MEQQLRDLIARHCATLEKELEDVRKCVEQLEDGHSVKDAIKEGIEMTHKIKGSSGSIGFADISAASALLEHCFRSLLENPEMIDNEARQSVAVHFQSLEQLVLTVRPESSSLYNVAL